VNILILSKHKVDTQTQFIDASGEDFFKKDTNNNVLTDEHIARIVNLFERKEYVEYVATSIDNSQIADNDYNLSVGAYVEAKDNREEIDIVKLNAELKQTVKRIDVLRTDIDSIISELEEGHK
jgi:type I restriction enzyme M protein